MELLLNISLLALLLTTAVAIAWTRDLFAAAMLAGIYGLLSASFFMAMGAVDVAFTEAAVGAGIAPLLILLTLALCGRRQRSDKTRAVLALILVAAVGTLLLAATLDMPAFGAADAPAHGHVAPRYIGESMAEIGIPNIVTSVLASYRAFDTLGEVVVIFTAGLGVLALLLGGSDSRSAVPSPALQSGGQSRDLVLRVVAKILIAPIMLFALYVQFHGEYGPGGGFQAGVIFAVGFILYGLVFGLDAVQRVAGNGLVQLLAAVGVMIYGAVGLLGLATGKNFLDYSALAGDPVSGQHVGIIAIELGVGITVAAVMILIFYAFSAQLRRDGQPAMQVEETIDEMIERRVG
ncbi:multisubunit sodium/proton antiporter, MrpB subunit (TC 2.A.63.1) [Microbulbifer donghaiensis]|uniref:Multisubunit sodium/proton antiporter, MrpB subunit (TC 2.A.63.1) n=1 Tax=Microbulbifer donghaiensis TaxID=494016 RepID=A0A1M4UI22_9GAMM|nr:DUF4040 domain-containing protein [Microbulbifer donghaiensis]SHE56314.1 multisubunit sodium/proton antiporter, MrpB subunit (TC 2.A.63.1) [Microbulbifer donghaiensis]